MKLYMKCTNDIYELPLAVADSPGELASMLGQKKGSVLSSISTHRGGFHRVEVEDMYPDNDGRLYYRDWDTGEIVFVED